MRQSAAYSHERTLDQLNTYVREPLTIADNRSLTCVVRDLNPHMLPRWTYPPTVHGISLPTRIWERRVAKGRVSAEAEPLQRRRNLGNVTRETEFLGIYRIGRFT